MGLSMVRRIDIFSLSFCISLAGLSLALYGRQSFWSLLAVLVLSPVIMLIYSTLAKRGDADFIDLIKSKLGNGMAVFFGVFCIIAAASSAMLGSKLFCSSVFDDRGYLVLLLLMLAAAAYFALSKPVAKARVATIVCIVAAFFLLLTLLLTLPKISSFKIDIDFDFKLKPFEIIGVCVFDLVGTFALLRKEHKQLPGALGSAAAPAYFCTTALISTMILSKEVLLSAKMPFILVWKTTFIGEFISHFEVYAICAVLAAAVIKSGAFLGMALKALKDKYSPVVYVGAVAAAIGAGFIDNWFFIYTCTAFVFGLLLPIVLLIKK